MTAIDATIIRIGTAVWILTGMGALKRWEYNRLDRDRDGRVERWELNRGPARYSYNGRDNWGYNRQYRDRFDR